MAEELKHLIAQYRVAGLTQAADWLEIAQGGLEARGLLPPSLEGVPVEGAADLTSQGPQSPPSTPEAELRRDRPVYGDEVMAVASRYDLPMLHRLELTYELDQLGLRKYQRNALVSAGFRTVADVVEAAELGILSSVRNLGESSARQITERVRAYLSVTSGTAASASQQDNPPLSHGQDPSGTSPEDR